MATSRQAHEGSPSIPSSSRVVLVVSRGPASGEHEGAASVPDLLGRPQGEALEHLQRAELNAQVFNDFSERVRHGHVIDQFPPPGAGAATGSEVVVLVSNGPAEHTTPTTLPDVVGLSEAEAVSRLHAASLEPDVVHDNHPNVAEGVVFAQLPSQSAIASEKRKHPLAWLWLLLAAVLAVAVAIAAFFLLTGAEKAVPDVVGLSQAQAEKAVTAAGFKVGTVTIRTDQSKAAGTVLEQAPEGGVEERQGSAIDLTVSAKQSTVKVPDVVGLTSADARTAIESAGLVERTATEYSDTVPAGNVIDQTPASGSNVTPGSAVTVSISLGARNANVTLPNLVGMSQATAVDKATSLGLTVRVSDEYSNSIAIGNVTSQIPEAGQSVAPGTTIGLSVSLGPAPAASVTVPDLTGQTSVNAQAALQALGLSSTTVSWDLTGQPAGTVVGQSPKAGEQVTANGTVVLFVSSGK